MQMSQLRPAYACAAQYGVKMLAHGGPGSGKTPLVKTLPRPVLCATEPGLLSLRDWDGPVWEAYTPQAINEFFAWLKTPEARNFDSVAIDSVSQMSEVFLAEALIKNKHGLKAYGEMAEAVMPLLRDLYYMQEKHIYLVAKQYASEEGGGLQKKRPYFPGKELNVKIPHLYDEILCVGTFQIPGVQGEQRAIRTLDSLTVSARDRSGRLDEYEPFDLGALITKCMTSA